MAEEIKRLQWIVHKGVTIARSDFRGLKGKEFVDQMHRNLSEILDRVGDGKRNLLMVSDFTDVPIIGDSYTEMRKVSETLAPHMIARAVLGVRGPKKFMLNAMNVLFDNSLRAFDSEKEAKEWLVERAVRR
ncbi:MAG: hypothetical protein AB1646_00775 [Thermodesulfobacteriota bacterium]